MKLEKHEHYKDTLAFCRLGGAGKFQSYIVYRAGSDTNDAARCAYELGTLDMAQGAGRCLHQAILEKFATSDELKWPPSAQDLGNMTDVIPPQLEKFLSYVIVDKPTPHTSKAHRLVQLIGQDICRAATHGEWKLPKHVLICLTLRHLFRNEKLITFLNRMGHTESYSFSLELETALAKAVAETSSLLSTQIVCFPDAPSVFHSEFDNLDQLLNNLTGMDSIHTAHGIMLQGTKGKPEDHGRVHVAIPSTSRKDSMKQRTQNLASAQPLPDCYVTQRKSPQLVIRQRTYPGSDDAFRDAGMQHLLWLLIRMKSSSLGQEVPGWTGFITMVGQNPQSLMTIDYYPVIASPITDYKTVTVSSICRRSHKGSPAATLHHYHFRLGGMHESIPPCLEQPSKIWETYHPDHYNPPRVCVHEDDREKDEWIGLLGHLVGSRVDWLRFSPWSTLR